jgi:hypothetical protein
LPSSFARSWARRKRSGKYGPGDGGSCRSSAGPWKDPTCGADGFSELDTRYTIQAQDGAMIYVQNVGLRHAPTDVMRRLLAGEDVDPSLVYFRTVPRFETAAASLQWLTRSIFVGLGTREPDVVTIRFFRLE